MNMRLLSLRALGPDSCEAVLEVTSVGRVTTRFSVDTREGIALAAADPDIFRGFDGTADEQRQIVAAVVAFCRVSSKDPHS